MKKHLIAVAVTSALAAPVMAQNVSVYGLMDAGVATSSTSHGASVTTKQKVIGGLHSANGTGTLNGSRLGFRGEEDLGGGLKAQFVFELGINYSNGQAATTSASNTDTTLANAAGMGNVRNGYLGLSGAFGTVRVGTQNSLNKDAMESIDPNGGVTMTGAASLYQAGLVGTRYDAITYISPNISGLTFQVQYDMGESTYTETATNDNKGVSYSAAYVNGPLRVVGTSETRRDTYLDATGINLVNLASGSVATPLAAATTVDKITQNGFGASYDFGVASLHALNTKLSYKDATAADTGEIKATLIGVSVPMGNVVLRGSMSSGSVSDNGTETYDLTAYQLVASYNLSKRTNAYAAIGQTKYDSPNANSDVTIKQMGVGVRHSF